MLWAVGWRLEAGAEPPLLTRSPPTLRAERSGVGMAVGWTPAVFSC